MSWNKYKSEIKLALDLFEFDEEILDILKNSIKKEQKIFIGGNGGSAALTSHYVCDLSKGANINWDKNNKRYKAISLSDNISYITAIANDGNYEQIFKEQLINLANRGDILILISSSGNSKNILKAAKYAKESGLIVIGITGFNGGKLKEICDYSAHINSKLYEICEDIHSIFGHFLAFYLRNNPP